MSSSAALCVLLAATYIGFRTDIRDLIYFFGIGEIFAFPVTMLAGGAMILVAGEVPSARPYYVWAVIGALIAVAAVLAVTIGSPSGLSLPVLLTCGISGAVGAFVFHVVWYRSERIGAS